MTPQTLLFEELASRTLTSVLEELQDVFAGDRAYLRDRVAALLTYTIMGTFGKLRELRRSTFISYERLIRRSLKHNKETNVVSFSYHLKDPKQLTDALNEAFAPVVFEVASNKPPSVEAVSQQRDQEDDFSLNRTADGEIIKVVRADDIWDLLSDIKRTIEKKVMKRRLSAEMKYVLTVSFFNCALFNDLKNADPTKFELVENEYLGHILRVLVSETMTRIPRYLYFFPVNSPSDPLLALHGLFSQVKPTPKTRSSQQETEQRWQMLRESLLNAYDRFLRRHTQHAILAIKRGPKSQLGRRRWPRIYPIQTTANGLRVSAIGMIG
ncbi:uncharacterized protein LALA0_S15e00694g [Lachancea lanzarotensis]|uniref:LALA0S15e00694g1_1 n=1 Tax=Lachancea lanzarotensis TaxID=1245769 RepID=A0A0C7N428_9SACH|nr:uncharacterized protein LALA0_S15e00694g [Lachancea lanzarotensis]CEP64934.1 LALA0S15e00694g1_1 [Lachancea lanzarotensis]